MTDFVKSSSISRDIIVILATVAEEKIMPRPAGDAASHCRPGMTDALLPTSYRALSLAAPRLANKQHDPGSSDSDWALSRRFGNGGVISLTLVSSLAGARSHP